MGNLFLECIPPPLDLKVTEHRFSLLFPAQKTERRCMFLSNIDQSLNFHVETIHFFEGNAAYPPEKVFEKIEDAFRRLLVPYDFLAGRLKFDPANTRFEVDCNSAGAGFAVASSELTLAEVGNLVYPNPAFRQLIREQHHQPALDSDEGILSILQVTSFKCGGFAMGISNNHALMDGLSFRNFLENLAALAADKPLAVIPYHDRQLLAARSPPRVTFSHPELLEIPQLDGGDQNVMFHQGPPADLDNKVFHLSVTEIIKLKKKAKMDIQEDEANSTKITSFNVVMAHIWRCKALSGATGENNPDKMSTILYAVDVRSRLAPPLPSSFTGNAVITAYGMAKLQDFKDRPFSYLVKMITEGTNRVIDEYVRSVIDWGELHKGFPYGDILVSSWWKLGFDDVGYPWGRSKYSCPLVHHRKDIILFFPDIDGVIDKGVNVLVALPSTEMKKFQEIFRGFLADECN